MENKELKPIKEHLDHFNIAGFTYYDAVDAFESLKIGTTLDLKLEPKNQYDQRAVMIYYKNHHLGYIPRSCNRIFYKLLRTGSTNIQVKIQRIDSKEMPENQVSVVSHLVEEY